MSSSNSKSDLSERLTSLENCYRGELFVWDIGCDHGQLGTSFKEHQGVKEINLVDPSLKVITDLKSKDSYITIPNLNIYHKKGQELKIKEKNNNLFFIAGMGGEEIKEIVHSLLPQLVLSSFVVSPHRKILELRSYLNGLSVSLISEKLIREGSQFYQLIHFSTDPHGRKVSLYGEDIWQSFLGEDYYSHQLKFFSRHRDHLSRSYLNFLENLSL